MKVRLTSLDPLDEVLVDGACADPPEEGRPFSVLVMSLEKLVVTGDVAHVALDHFVTLQGTRYSWARCVGEA